MNRTGINRRHLLTMFVAVLGTGACNTIPAPRMGGGPPNVGVRSAMRLGPAPVKAPDAKFAFVQINGAPATHLMAFSRALNKEAAARNLTVVPVDDPSATYLVKGYLSAIGDSSGTLLVYVWDVTDSSGRRLHRVSGQETAGGSSTDPWSGISRQAVDNAASHTIDDLVAWVS